jgi:P63C domain
MKEEKDIQSLGGKARAEKLSKEARKEIASNAALVRWSREGTQYPTAKYGSPDRPLRIGNLDIPCYVLDDGRRVITQAGMLLALEMSAGTATKGGGDRLTNFATTKSIKPFVSDNLMEMIKNPVRFRGHGSLSYGYEATILAEICDAVLSCREAGELNHQQEHIAKQAEILVRAFAKVGIVALVDEATGYQEIRNREALQEILKRFISEELLEWVRTFPTEFYKQLFRLKGWNWNEGRMSPIVGSIVNDLVYSRLAPGVLEELKKRNPVTENGHRQNRHFQHLTADVGHPELTRHLYELIGMARAFSVGQWDRYYELVNRTFPKLNASRLLPFNPEDAPA